METNVTQNKFSILDNDFFTLLRAGLWEKSGGTLSDNPDWESIYKLSCTHGVQGLMAEGISVMGVESLMPYDVFNSFITDCSYIVIMNRRVNVLQGKLCDFLDSNGIKYAILKGQPLGQSYEKPEFRRSGDIDFLVTEEDFDRVNSIFSAIAGEPGRSYKSDFHYELEIDGIRVETHAKAKSYFFRRLDRTLEAERRKMFAESSFGHYEFEGQKINIPTTEYNAVFLLSHILRHLRDKGVKLKQMCDWVRFIYANKDVIDHAKFQKLLKASGICGIWKKFSVFAVEWMGLSPNDLLIYDPGHKEDISFIWMPAPRARKLEERQIGNFWLHYLNGFKDYAFNNLYVWNISKKAYVEKLRSMFLFLSILFVKKLFGIGGERFHLGRFKQS